MKLRLSGYSKYLFGVLCKIISLISFCLLSLTLEKSKDEGLTSIEQFSLFSFVGFVFLAPIVFIFFKDHLKSSNIFLYPLRAFLGICGMVTWTEAMRYFGSQEGILVTYCTPIFTLLLVSILNQERFQMKCFISALICLLTMFIGLNQKIMLNNYGFFIALLSSFFWSIYEVVCKKQTFKEHYVVQAFYTLVFAVLFLSPIILSKIHIFNEVEKIKSIVIIGILRVINVILLFLAIKFATINWLAPVSYMKFPIMAILGNTFFSKAISTNYYIVAVIFTIINIYITFSRKLNQK